MLEEAGPDAASLRQVARRVAVFATAARRYFADKEELLSAVAAEGFRELAEAMTTGATESDRLGGVGLNGFWSITMKCRQCPKLNICRCR
jgi:AcrR family transcriptional regulator